MSRESPMDRNRFQRIEECFEEALKRDGEERSRFLDKVCQGDPALREEVESLLLHHQEAEGGLLDIPALERKLKIEPPSLPERIGHFEIKELLGEGGMGAVYLAEQSEPIRRQVALKLIKLGMDTKEVIARFEAERQALALMSHPGIAKVYEAGATGEGRPYFTMEHVPGPTITDHCDQKSLTLAERLELFLQVCGAVQHAHQRGIIHRDIKPSNILVTTDESQALPKIIDFGIAKAVGQRLTEKTFVTQRGVIIGTPAYVSPEQLEMVPDIDTRTDVYSLGVLLYELLVGTLPFEPAEGGYGEIRRQILETESPRPSTRLSHRDERSRKIAQKRRTDVRTLRRQMHGDLDWIALKALEKDRTRRYASVSELAADIRRHLTQEPVLAGPPGSIYKLNKFIRRHKLGAAVVFFIFLGLLAGIVGLAMGLKFAREELEFAQSVLFDTYTTTALGATEENDLPQAFLWLTKAASLNLDDPRRKEACRIRLNNWLSRLPVPTSVLRHQGGGIRHLEFHPSGGYLLVLAESDHCTVWDVAGEKPIDLPGGDHPGSAATWSPDGKSLALGFDGQVDIFGFPGGEEIHRLISPGQTNDLTFSPNGQFLATAGDQVRIWDSREKRLAVELQHPKPVRNLAFDFRGERLLTACEDGMVRLFSISRDGGKAKPLFGPVPHLLEGSIPNHPFKPSFTPKFIDEERGILTATGPTEVTWWDVKTGEKVQVIPSEEGLAGFTADPGGRFFAILGPGKAQVWDSALERNTGWSISHLKGLTDATFSPDGSSLLTCGLDQTARLWVLPAPKTLGPLRQIIPPFIVPHQKPVLRVAYSPDALFFSTVQADGLIRIWKFREEKLKHHLMTLSTGIAGVALSRDGRHLMPLKVNFYPRRTTRVFDVATGEPAGPPLDAGGYFIGGGLSPDEPNGFTLSNNPGSIRFWNWRSGELLSTLKTAADPWAASYRPDGRLLALSCADGKIFLVDPDEGLVVRELRKEVPGGQNSSNGKFQVLFAPDGRSILSWGSGEPLQAWEAETGKLIKLPPGQRLPCSYVSFTSDGRQMALVAPDGIVTVWNSLQGQLLASLNHPELVQEAIFSLDGHSLLTICKDGAVRVWDWQNSRMTCPPLWHKRGTPRALFAAGDKRWIVSVSSDGFFRAWESQTGKAVMPPREVYSFGWMLAAQKGSCTIVGDAVYQVFHTPSLFLPLGTEIDLEGLTTLGELLSGKTIHREGHLEDLSTEDWFTRWKELRGKYPEHFSHDSSTEGTHVWHRYRTSELQQDFQWDAAAWHLDRLGEAATKKDKKKRLELEEFVRSWRFAEFTQPWSHPFDGELPPMDRGKLNRIVKSAASAKLITSRSPFVEFLQHFPERPTNIAGYAVRTLKSYEDKEVKIYAGSDDAIRIWLNGLPPILEVVALRPALADQEVVTAKLVRGMNTLVVEICQDTNHWGMYIRFEDLNGRKLRLTDDGRLEPLE